MIEELIVINKKVKELPPSPFAAGNITRFINVATSNNH